MASTDRASDPLLDVPTSPPTSRYREVGPTRTDSLHPSGTHRSSSPPPPLSQEDGLASINLERITEVLVNVARGEFGDRAPRSYDGSPWDVLAFMVNATAEEVEHLVAQVDRERQQLRQARDQLVHAEKFATLGELAGGIAHELNQPLMAIQALTEMMLDHPERTIEERRGELELIQRATSRMGRMIGAVRNFRKAAELRFQPTDVLDVLDQSFALMAEALRSGGVTFEIRSDGNIPLIEADAESLEQVFINLIANARDAMVEHDAISPRELRVRVRSCGVFVQMLFEDTGPGVDEAIQSRIFDAYFSTKSTQRGTGLGLSISHGIVLDHHGSLRYMSSDRGGSCFVVTLPIQRHSLPADDG